jgi:hypothetical protein
MRDVVASRDSDADVDGHAAAGSDEKGIDVHLGDLRKIGRELADPEHHLD